MKNSIKRISYAVLGIFAIIFLYAGFEMLLDSYQKFSFQYCAEVYGDTG